MRSAGLPEPILASQVPCASPLHAIPVRPESGGMLLQAVGIIGLCPGSAGDGEGPSAGVGEVGASLETLEGHGHGATSLSTPGHCTCIFHPIRVMMRCTSADAKITALLHDVIEDTPVTFDELEAEGFSADVLSPVVAASSRHQMPPSRRR